MENMRIVSRPAAAAKGPAMAAPNQKALQANNNNRKALGDISNLVGAMNAKCNINKDAVMERSGVNLVVNVKKGAKCVTQQSQADGIVARAEAKAEAKVVQGNKQRRTIRRNAQNANATQKDTVVSISDSIESAQNANATQKDTVVSISDSIESSAQDGGLKAPSQLKASKPSTMLTAQSEDAYNDFHEVLPSIDDGDLENQLAVVEYVEDIYKFYKTIENMSCVPPDYMKRQHVEITEAMRAILIDWLIEVHLKFELMPETLYLTVYIIDRYLSLRSVRKWKLQLVGITAMLIACKYQDIWAPQVNELVRISAKQYTSKMIVAEEHTILNRLKINLTVPTPYVFLVRFLKAAGPDKVMENLAFYLLELCLLHYKMIKYSPSMLAAAAVYTAQCTLKKDPCWSNTLTLHTGYSKADLKECAHFMFDFHLSAEGNELRVVHTKYSDPLFGYVAFLSPANLPDGDSCTTNNYAVISISDSIDSSPQAGGLKIPSQLKARKPRAPSLTAMLTAQSEDARRDFHEVLPSIDDGDIENKLAVVEYGEDIYEFYGTIENMSCVPPDYMRNQVEINAKMRAVVIHWLMEVHLTFKLMPETLYLTVNIIDRYLSTQSVTKEELPIVGIAAIFIASKYEEVWHPEVNELICVFPGEYKSEQIVAMESTILKQLKFKFTVPTPYVFLLRFLKAAGPDKVMENLALFLVELCLLQYIMIKYSPSMLAAAAVYTARCTLRKDPYWNKTLTLHTGYSEADLKECADFMVDCHLNAGINKLRAVHTKYSDPFFGYVSFLSPAKLPADDSCSSSN